MHDGKLHSPKDLAQELRVPLANVVYHVQVLKDCRAIKLEEERPVGSTTQHFYRMTVDEPWALAMLGLETD
jgi:hypothetical protein